MLESRNRPSKTAREVLLSYAVASRRSLTALISFISMTAVSQSVFEFMGLYLNLS